MIGILEYERDRMKDERGSDYSGVRALNAVLSFLSKDYVNENDVVIRTLLREVQGEEDAKLYNTVARKLHLLYNDRLIGANVILLCTYIVKKIREEDQNGTDR
jgi:hypothetical protein